FQHGYGIKSKGMGGVGVALPQDALAAASNPAGMALIGDRIDFGIDYFRPIRSSDVVGNAAGAPVNGHFDASENRDYVIPEFGYNKMINPRLALGVSVYGNGGMNTSYTTPIPLFGTTKAGVDLMQLFIAPTVAYKITPQHSLGLSVNFAYQRFKASGLQNFDRAPVTSAPGSVTDNGYDSSTGWGLRVGWTGQVSDTVTLGATYQSKTSMGKFDKYRGLFAEQGGFDIPANYAVGIAVKATPRTTVAFDVERIQYGSINSVGNPLLPNLFAAPLGANNGAGFGWRDTTVFKLGADYRYSDRLTLRAGWNYNRQPIPQSETLFNILAPGVVEHHVTLGATWTLANKSELSVGYMHAFEKKLDGANSIPAAFGGGNANLKMYQDSIGIAYGWKM
ncbi:MAG TPA: outer membrane protein transport protein, partial [Burkholderiales bacterium]|nr:outer membrane protein transport protein [Burkholderiales bacterium]